MVSFGEMASAARGLLTLVTSQARKKSDAADWEFVTDLQQTQRKSPSTLHLMPEPGSEDHKRAERLVAKGLLLRAGRGPAYRIA